MRTIRRPISGLTVVELVVAVAILAVLAALALPAIQSARESARRLQCTNNLRQLGAAVHSYSSALGCLPPGRLRTYDPRFSGTNPPCTATIVDKSILIFLLPFLEQVNLHDSINQNLTIFGPENSTVHLVSVGAYSCPSDTESGWPRPLRAGALAPYGLADSPDAPHRMVFTSYAGCTGSFAVTAFPTIRSRCRALNDLIAQSNGCFNDIAGIRMDSISDGLSNTILLSEKSTSSYKRLGRVDNRYFQRFGWYVSGNFGDTLFTSFYPPNSMDKAALAAGSAHTRSASSSHPGGVCVLMADGSSRFIKDSIQSWPFSRLTGRPVGSSQDPRGWWVHLPPPGVWQRLTTRSDGEAVDVESL